MFVLSHEDVETDYIPGPRISKVEKNRNNSRKRLKPPPKRPVQGPQTLRPVRPRTPAALAAAQFPHWTVQDYFPARPLGQEPLAP